MNKKEIKLSSFYTQSQRNAGKVLLILSILASCIPEGVAAPGSNSGTASSSMVFYLGNGDSTGNRYLNPAQSQPVTSHPNQQVQEMLAPVPENAPTLAQPQPVKYHQDQQVKKGIPMSCILENAPTLAQPQRIIFNQDTLLDSEIKDESIDPLKVITDLLAGANKGKCIISRDCLWKLIEAGIGAPLEVGMNTSSQILVLLQMLIEATKDEDTNVCLVALQLLDSLGDTLITGTKEQNENVRSVASKAPACKDVNNPEPITDQSFRQRLVKMAMSAFSQQTTHKSAPSRPEPAVQQKKVEAHKQKSQEKTIDVRNLGYYRITLTTFVKALRQRILGIWYGNQVKERQLQITEQQLQITKQQLRIKKQELKITEQQLKIKKQQLQQDPCQGRESKQDSAQPAEANSAMINSPVIDAAVWERYFGDVDFVPPLPNNLRNILNSPCPFWENKTVKETHLLVLIPAQVAGKPLTLDYLGALIQSPKGYGRKAQYTNYWCKAHPAIGNQSLDRSYWVLMTKDVLPESCDKSYQEQRALVAEYANGTGLAYKVPKALEAAVVMSLQHVRSGQRLYGEDEDYWKYTRCRKDQIIVGFSPSEGLIVDGIKPEYQEPRCGVRVLLPLIYPLDIVEQA